jgi:hypothetical protein
MELSKAMNYNAQYFKDIFGAVITPEIRLQYKLDSKSLFE